MEELYKYIGELYCQLRSNMIAHQEEMKKKDALIEHLKSEKMRLELALSKKE